MGKEIGATKNIFYVLGVLSEYGYVRFEVRGRKRIPVLTLDGWWLYTFVFQSVEYPHSCPICQHNYLLMVEEHLSHLPFFTPTLRPASPHDYDTSRLCMVHQAEVKGLLRGRRKRGRNPNIHRETQEVRP